MGIIINYSKDPYEKQVGCNGKSEGFFGGSAQDPKFCLSWLAGPSPRLPRLWAPEKRGSVPERKWQMLEVEYGLEKSWGELNYMQLHSLSLGIFK